MVIYTSSLESPFHLPSLFQHPSFASELMATVAPPNLNECTPRQGLKIPQAQRPGLEN
jgi:hypothetical protein